MLWNSEFSNSGREIRRAREDIAKRCKRRLRSYVRDNQPPGGR